MTGIGRRSAPRFLLGVVLATGTAGLLAGCDDANPYSAPTFPFQRGFSAADRAAPVLLSNANWWTRFSDPVLSGLINRAVTGNLTLAAARERVVQSRADRKSVV